jgi:hypothetical protein
VSDDELDILRASLLSGGPRELHITRASQWTEADQHPITRAEWESFAEAHPKLSHGAASRKKRRAQPRWAGGSTDTGWTPVYAFTCKDGAKVWLSWGDDHVAARGELLGHEAALATLAVQIRARLLDDDEDEYLPDGSRVHWDESRKPITPLDGAVTRCMRHASCRAASGARTLGVLRSGSACHLDDEANPRFHRGKIKNRRSPLGRG